MFDNRIELESDGDRDKRYDRIIDVRQRTYEFLWELKESFGVFGRRLFGGLAEEALKQLGDTNFEDIGRRRFFRVTNFLRVPLPSIHS